jgi:hypothetical protein
MARAFAEQCGATQITRPSTSRFQAKPVPYTEPARAKTARDINGMMGR